MEKTKKINKSHQMASKNNGKITIITRGGQQLKSCSYQNLVTMSVLTSPMTSLHGADVNSPII